MQNGMTQCQFVVNLGDLMSLAITGTCTRTKVCSRDNLAGLLNTKAKTETTDTVAGLQVTCLSNN